MKKEIIIRLSFICLFIVLISISLSWAIAKQERLLFDFHQSEWLEKLKLGKEEVTTLHNGLLAFIEEDSQQIVLTNLVSVAGSFTRPESEQRAHLIGLNDKGANFNIPFYKEIALVIEESGNVILAEGVNSNAIVNTIDVNGDGLEELLLAAGGTGQGMTVESATLVQIEHGSLRFAEDFGEVYLDNCGTLEFERYIEARAIYFVPKEDEKAIQYRIESSKKPCYNGDYQDYLEETYQTKVLNQSLEPEIKSARATYDEVLTLLFNDGLMISKREFSYCQPYVDTLRQMALDESSVVRYYRNEAGSDDSFVSAEHYYGLNGELQFVLIKANAVNGTKLEHYIYLDASGKRLLEDEDLLEGPGYTFPAVWPEDEIIFKPKVAFQADNICPEEKRVQFLNLRTTLSETIELEDKGQEVVFDFNPKGRQEERCSIAIFNNFKEVEIPAEFTEQIKLADYHTLSYLAKNEKGGSGGDVFVLQGVLSIANTLLYRVEGRDQKELPSKGNAEFCLELFGRLEPQPLADFTP